MLHIVKNILKNLLPIHEEPKYSDNDASEYVLCYIVEGIIIVTMVSTWSINSKFGYPL